MRTVLALVAALALGVEGAVSALAARGIVLSAVLAPARVSSASLDSVRLRYSLSAPARVEIDLGREVAGYRLHGLCLPPRPEFRGFPRCRTTIPLKRLVVRDARGGAHVRPLARAFALGSLAPGRYRVRVKAVGQERGFNLVLTVER
jgi:hypothetical protein